MIALATPFGTFVADAVKSTTQGLFDVNQNALNSTGLINIDGQEFESCAHEYEMTGTTANCTTAGTTTYTCKLCGKTYSEETPAGHTWDNTGLTCTMCGVTIMTFTIDGVEYKTDSGITSWEQWLESKYNTNGFVLVTATHKNTQNAISAVANAERTGIVHYENNGGAQDAIGTRPYKNIAYRLSSQWWNIGE